MASNISVPIFRFGQPWGDLQIAFVDTKTELGWSRYGTWGLLAFTIPICPLQFSFFIKWMVLALNPEGAIPGNAMNGDREKCIQIGCDDLRSKPANPDSLLECCQTNLGHGKTVAESTITNRQRTEDPVDAEPPVVGNIVFKRPESQLGKETAPPIHTTIPIDDEELRKVVVHFIDRMDARLSGMEDAVRQADFDTLQNEAHWLKGSGGTVGFPALTAPSTSLMHAARDGQVKRCQESLRDIIQIRQRLVVPHTTNPTLSGQS